MQETNKIRYAGFFVRLWAVIIDSCIVAAVLILVRLPVWAASLAIGFNPLKIPVLFRFTTWDILAYMLGCIYYVAMIYMCGATIGKKALKLKVISADAERLSFLTVLYRETVGKYLSGALVCIGYLIIGPDKEKRGLHDVLCDTRVIYDLGSKKSEKLEGTYMVSAYQENEDIMQEEEKSDKGESNWPKQD